MFSDLFFRDAALRRGQGALGHRRLWVVLTADVSALVSPAGHTSIPFCTAVLTLVHRGPARRMFEMAKDEIVESQTFEIMAGYYSPV